MIALYIYLTILTLNVIFALIVAGRDLRAITFVVFSNAASAYIGYISPEWLLWTFNGLMVVSFVYSYAVFYKMGIISFGREVIIVEEDYDVDEDADRIPADVLKAWSEVYNAPQRTTGLKRSRPQ